MQHTFLTYISSRVFSRLLGVLMFFLGFDFASYSQLAPTYVDWVRPNQQYLEVKVGRNGVYRLNVPILQESFPNLPNLNVAGFQLFRRGIEQAIFVNAGADNILNGNDYIDFVGLINDATTELEMYQKPLPAYNAYRSVYDDTAYYYLTYSSALNGKRVVNNGLNNNSSIPFETYHWRTAATFNYKEYLMGRGLRGNVTFASYFTAGEGWAGNGYSVNFGDQPVLNSFMYTGVGGIQNLFNGGPDPQLELLQYGRRDVNHRCEVLLSTNLTTLDTFRFAGITSYLFKKSFSANLIQNNTLHIWPAPRGTANMATAYALVRYPATFQMPNGLSSLEFDLLANPNNYSRLRFENLGQMPELYDISNPSSPIRVGVGFISGSYIAGVDNTAESRKMLIQNQPFVVGAQLAKSVSFRPFVPANFDYIIVTNSALRRPALGLNDPVGEYAAYRSTPEGGSHRVLTLDIEEVYQRFGYGDRNPMSIRNLCGFFVQNNIRPKALFLIGKGITVNRRFNSRYRAENMVPTFGNPASDNAFVVGLGEPERTIAFPVGRLAATTPQQVAIYLNKVKESEAFQYDNLWKKNAFHISGGLTPLEQSAFRIIMNSELSSRIEGKFYGARVGRFNRSSNQTIEYVNIKQVLNNGISLLNLFGHSSRSSPDVEIGRASDPTQGFNNQGRYPMVIINGCFSGNIYDFDQSLNEDWIFTPNKGAVMFWAASDEGLSALLRRHINLFYQVAFQDSAYFAKPFGQIQKETMRRYLANLSAEPQLDSAFMHQFMLHGDPVLKIFGAEKPDYKTSNQEVFISTTNYSASSSSIRVGCVVSNFGRFSGDSLQVRVGRRYSDGNTSSFIFRVKPIAYQDTLYFDLPQTENFVYSGNNRVEVFLDFLNREDELRETNNIGVIEFFVPATAILPLFPKKYGIVSSRNVRMTVQATDFFAPGRRYVFQIDTSANFNSPVFAQSPPIVAGNLCTWNYLLPFDRDSTVFFWRVRFADQSSVSDTTWFHMSFEYIKNAPGGWSQAHFFQFREALEEGLVKAFFNRKWFYPIRSTLIDIQVSGGSRSGPRFYNCTLDGIPVLTGTVGTSDCFNPGYPRICAITIDKCSMKPKFWNYSYDPVGYYYTGCGRLPFSTNIFEFTSSFNTMRTYFQNFIQNIVQPGDYVLLFPVDSVPMDSLKKYGASVLPLIGVSPDSLNKLGNGHPFIFLGQRTELPSPGQAQMLLPVSTGTLPTRQQLSLRRELSSACATGLLTSTRIGPATRWFQVHNRVAGKEPNNADKYTIGLKGLRLDGSDTTLVKEIPQFPFDISWIDASQFPYLRLSATFIDSVNNTPAILKRWTVTYDAVPEGVINTSIFPAEEYKRGKIQEGDSLQFRFAFTNISDRPFRDSLKVAFQLNGAELPPQYLRTLLPDSTARFALPRFSTLGRGGQNHLLAFVNPRIQPEEYYENNALSIPFRVEEDKTQPVLDVTFDGVKIMNGDFVSNQPLISVVLKDENKHLIKQDTSGMQLLITRPCLGCLPERIALNSPNVKYYPAGKDNLFRIEYKPDRLENGTYRLAVQGTDVKGNPSGTQFYQVDFQVLDQKTITNVFPYPNPFSTSCQWVFTVTGELPSDFKIQIMTVTGRVVREIMQAELGPLKIGNNVTSYRWNGTDEFGDRLANGVYLYRVVMKEPSTFAKRQTAGDFTFTKGFGKLYIIR